MTEAAWRAERPSEEGGYWFRDRETQQVDLGYVTLKWNGEPNVSIVGHIYPKLLEFECEWYGPLEVPQ